MRRSNIRSKCCYMFLHMKSIIKNIFLAFLGIFEIFWLFSEIFGYFLCHSYQIWLFWYKIRILQLILEHTGILNQSLDKVGINNAVLVLYSTTVHCLSIVFVLTSLYFNLRCRITDRCQMK